MKLKPNSKLQSKLKLLPSKPGVYLLKNSAGAVIYIGKAVSLKNRVRFHTRAGFASQLSDLEYFETKNELAALLLENRLIKKFKPKYNVSLRDDKQYPYLKLTNEEWPRLIITRKKLRDGGRYFGRFTGGAAKELLRIIKKIFPIRWCKPSPLKERLQPCLYENLDQCIAPCVTNRADKTRYYQLVRRIESFLQGDFNRTISQLERDMLKAAQNQQFEWAADLRNKIKRLKILINPRLSSPRVSPPYPGRIEGFDVSNLAGTENVGSLVVFENGKPKKSDYRKFKLRRPETPDDVASIFEVVGRRYTGSLKDKLPLPDLILIDGGPGQVQAALRAVKNTPAENISIIGLAKKFERIYSPNPATPLPPLPLLQRVRDEAHRFAIGYHKLRRKKSLFRNKF